MNKVIVASDLSARGKPAIERARAIASATGAALLIVHAVDDEQPPDMGQAAVEEQRNIYEPRSQRRGRSSGLTMTS